MAPFVQYLWLVSQLLCIFVFHEIHSHPQCLDFYPPFKSQDELTFCKDHENYGCCGAKYDKRLQFDFDYIKQQLNESTIQRCSIFLKQILCSGCHPYAAHIYDAEDPNVYESYGFKKRLEVFPGLCKDYCEAIFDSCRDVVKLIARSKDFLTFVSKSEKEQFCAWAEPSDKDYCLPNINNQDQVKRKFVSNSKDVIVLCVQDVQYQLRNPLLAVPANDGSHRLFVGEQRGVVKTILADGRMLPIPFLNITDRVLNSGSSWDERGFLGLAFHPKYKDNGRIFVYYSHFYTNSQEQSENREAWWLWKRRHYIRISEFLVSADDPYVVDTFSEKVILQIEQPEANHEGGMILFGEDGYLYIFVGDGGGAGDVHGKYGNALNMSTLLGKVLRIDVDTNDERPYEVPKDNPFLSRPDARSEIYAYGVRNMWRCSKDRGDNPEDKNKGRLFCGDVGQNAHEEIDIIYKGGNYGWRAKEGFSCYDLDMCNPSFLENEVTPIISYDHSVGKSIVGGYVYRGCKYPNMRGYYFYADTVTGRIFASKENPINKVWEVKEVLLGNSSYCNNGMHSNIAQTILSFGEDEAGELYILSTTFPDPQVPHGRIYRLVDPFRRQDPEKCRIRVRLPQRRGRRRKRRKHRKANLVKERHPSIPCADKLKMCSYFRGKVSPCNIIRKFVTQYCPLACGLC